jgi:hypothetical protein
MEPAEYAEASVLGLDLGEDVAGVEHPMVVLPHDQLGVGFIA